MDSQDSTTIKIDPANVETFSSSTSPFSTFFLAKFEIANVFYDSVEKYYQACKIFNLIGGNEVWVIKDVAGPVKTKQIAKELIKKHKIPNYQLENWKKSSGITAVYHGTFFKFVQNKHLRPRLFKTGTKLIVHDFKADMLFSSGCGIKELTDFLKKNQGKYVKACIDKERNTHSFPVIGKGMNMLGFVLMMVREKLKTMFPQEWEAAQKQMIADEASAKAAESNDSPNNNVIVLVKPADEAKTNQEPKTDDLPEIAHLENQSEKVAPQGAEKEGANSVEESGDVAKPEQGPENEVCNSRAEEPTQAIAEQ